MPVESYKMVLKFYDIAYNKSAGACWMFPCARKIFFCEWFCKADSCLNEFSHLQRDGQDYTWAAIYTDVTAFQELYFKLNTMASIAAEMFVGKERFATLLLMKLTETIILWLSQDQSFWDDIEDGPKPLGPLALQQVWDLNFAASSFSISHFHVNLMSNRNVNLNLIIFLGHRV